jgi:hypothetical protein
MRYADDRTLHRDPQGPIVVADIPPQLLMDEPAATRLRWRLSRALGEIPVLLRCGIGNSLSFSGDPNLQRYAVGPMIDALPAVRINLGPPLREAA